LVNTLGAIVSFGRIVKHGDSKGAYEGTFIRYLMRSSSRYQESGINDAQHQKL
jgi:hypothetical protein